LSLCFDSPLGYIEFSAAVLDIFNRHRQTRFWSREAGGQLFYRVKDNKIIIDYATEPMHRDKRSRFSFLPNRKQEQLDIDVMFVDGLHYIGDWHTHPEDVPNPSGEDANKMKAIFRESKHVLAGMLLVVVGRQQTSSGLWCGIVDDKGLMQLNLAQQL
jgi:integrative and conjugative element protein (TIGR02256 family)